MGKYNFSKSSQKKSQSKSVGVLAPKKPSAIQKALGNMGANVLNAVSNPKSFPSPKSSSGGVSWNNTGQAKSVGVLAPKGSTVNAKSNFTNNFGVPLAQPLSNAKSNFTNNFGRGSISPSNISADGTALVNTRTFDSASSFSSTPGSTNNLSTNPSGTPRASVVNSQLKPVTPITLPTPAVSESPTIAPVVTPEADIQAKEKKTQDDYMAGLLKDFNDRETGAEIDAKLQRELQIEQKQQLVTNLSGKLNAIVNKGEADKLSLIGQGRGIPTAILGGQAAELSRQTAIEALPISAQLDAAQGSLEMAEQSLDRLYKIYQQDSQNEFEYKQGVRKAVYDFSTASQKRELEKLDKQEERDYKETQATLKDIKDIATTAMKEQAPANVLSNIFKAKTYQEAVTAAGKYGGGYLERELLLQQIANVKSQISERNNVANSYGTVSGKPQNATQAAANGYADRIAEADVIIGNLGKKFTGKYAFGGSLPNAFQSNDRQMYEQAKRNFLTAQLRRESGAAIAESEFVTAEKQYFPQAGDQGGVISQKEVSRNTAINNLYRESNVNRPVLPGQIIESNGVRYRVGMDGQTLDIIQ